MEVPLELNTIYRIIGGPSRDLRPAKFLRPTDGPFYIVEPLQQLREKHIQLGGEAIDITRSIVHTLAPGFYKKPKHARRRATSTVCCLDGHVDARTQAGSAGRISSKMCSKESSSR
jgi:hypothetical protein